jgi:hypothetical protein
MTHKDGRVVLSAWVEPVLRDYAREAARAAGVQFSLWVEGAVQRAVAEQSAAKALRIYPVHASHLTDVVTLLEDERDKLRAERRQLRARLVECRPWVGVCPYPNTPRFSEMIAVRDLADDTLEEVKP